MSEQPASALEAFYDEFLDLDGTPAASTLDRDIINAVHGDRLERGRDAVVGAVQESGALPIVAAGTMAVSSVSSALSPVLAAAHNLSRGVLVSHRTEHGSRTGSSQPDEANFKLQPGGSIYPIAVQEAPIMGVSIEEAVEQIETASNIAPSQVTDLAIGTEITVPLHYKFTIVPQGRDLNWIDAQNGMTLNQFLEMNPTYRRNPNLVEAGAAVLVAKSAQTTTVTSTPKSRPYHHERQLAVTPTGGTEAPAAPAQSPEKPDVLAPQPKAAVVAPREHTPVRPHHSPTVVPEKPQKLQLKTAHSTRPKVPLASSPSFGTGLQLDLRKAFSTGVFAAETPDRLGQNMLGHVASITRGLFKGVSPSHAKRYPHETVTHGTVEKNPATVGKRYDIYSNVLTKSGFSAAALRYALSQMEGGSMADLADDIHLVEQKYGINSLYTAAAGCIESACGTSNFARERNNYFGIEAYTNNPNAASTYASKRQNVIAFARLLHDNYLHPGAQYWGGSGSLHSIYKNYSTSHDSEALSISEVMNTLASHANYFNEMHGLASGTTTPSSSPQPAHSFHRSSTKSHAKKTHHSAPSSTSSLYKSLARRWNHPLG